MFVIQFLRPPILRRQLRISAALMSSTTNPTSLKTEGSTSTTETALQVRFGQPTASTHPHLLAAGELVPGVTMQEFQQRRERLMRGLQKYVIDNSKKDSNLATNCSQMVIIPSGTKKYMSDKIPYVFRQNTDFYYLTGCLEQDSVLVMSINDKAAIRSSLFMRPKDKHAELWDGPRTGVDHAPNMFGVDEAFAMDFFGSILKQRLQSEKPNVWYDAQQSEQQKLNELVAIHNSPNQFIQGMRLFKSAAEENLMRRTCRIASQAINETMCEARPGISEHQLFAMLDFKCRWQHASYLAYPPVVASGANATTIHYINNTQLTRSGDLVLVDAGCEYGGYTSDITRTWPINSNFTPAQRVLYDIALTLQKDLIASILKEGGDTLDNLFETMCIKLGKYLQEAGLVSQDITDPIDYGRVGYKFCPHHVSHYLGMDVHDTPLIPRNLRLSPGMVFTVEPGIYIEPDRTDVPIEFRGLGVRIEDDVLITQDKIVEVLTSSCMKELSDLENLCNRKNS